VLGMVAFAAVVLADGLTKLLLPSETQVEDHGRWSMVLHGDHAGSLWPGWVPLAGYLCFLAFALWPPTRVAGCAVLAASLSNRLWTLAPGGVPNPFVADGRDGAGALDRLVGAGWVSYNVADVVIIVGCWAIVALVAVYTARAALRVGAEWRSLRAAEAGGKG